MDRLGAMRMFVTVVERGSFTQAAKELHCSNSTVTEAIHKLERYLGVRLLRRTTRQVSLTWEGEQYYERVRQTLTEIEEIETAIGDMRSTPSGRLTIEAPTALGRAYVVPALPRFTKTYPQIEAILLLNPRPPTVLRGQTDVSILLGELENADVIAKPIYEARHVASAAASFLQQHGEPKHPSELQGFNCLGFLSSSAERVFPWRFEQNGEVFNHEPRGNLQINSSEALIDVAIDGAGIIYMPDILVRAAISKGALKPLLTGWKTLPRKVFLVRPQRHHTPAKVKAFMLFIEALFADIAERSHGAPAPGPMTVR